MAPVMDCAAVAQLDLSGATDAPVTIQSAAVVTAGAPAPYCAVQGTIALANTFVMRLPTQGWTQRYLQTGCGGLCGSATINYTAAGGYPPVADGTIASATTDMGHQGQPDGSWAAGNPQAQIDFAYRGVHVTSQVAKAIIAQFYGKLPLIHVAVVAACDKLDGVAGGLLDDPRRCHFDPASLLRAPGQDETTCLRPAEAGVVRRLHDGATDAQGRRLEQRISHEWGSELDRTLFVPAAPGQPTFSESIALSFLRYLATFNIANPNYQLSDFQFTVPTFWQTVQTSVYTAATDPDLRPFAGHGGKLLLWHGWSDQHITPQSTLEYYEAMRDVMGAEAVEDFAKHYLFPGVAHCSGGLGPDTFDMLTPVMAWVETGTPPGEVVASKVENGAVTRMRPVFPYPAVARYVGAGSTDDAANFVAVTRGRSCAPAIAGSAHRFTQAATRPFAGRRAHNWSANLRALPLATSSPENPERRGGVP